MYDEAEVRARIAALETKFAHQFERSPGHWLGIDVGLGWIDIVEALCARIDRELTPFERRRFRWSQIKQKWAELRAYYHLDGSLARLHVDVAGPMERLHFVAGKNDPLSTKVDAFIREAAEAASRTCEVCGAPGRRSKQGGWFLVACQRHEDAKSTVPPGPGEQT